MHSFFRTMVLLAVGAAPLAAQGETLSVQGSTTVNPVVTEALEILEGERGLNYRIDTLGGSAGEILEQGCCDAVFGNSECRALFERMQEKDGE